MFTLNARGRLLTTASPLVMGIINTTPDSFYEDSRFREPDSILRQAEKMIREGAAVLDIGGQSTRPSSNAITAEEEMQRVIPAIESLHYNFPDTVLSVDTYYAPVAEAAVAAGAGMINDIGGGAMDAAMIPLAGRLRVPYICMHLKGTPSTMQQHAVYGDVTREVLDYFIHKIAVCRQAGIHDLIIDPGFGFAKTTEHNFRLLKELRLLSLLDKPVLAGVSRKGMVYKTLGLTAAEALNGTTALHMAALLNGASLLRVHDVKEAVETVRLYDQLR